MDAVVQGEECEVDPTPQWVETALSRLSTAGEGSRFLCLIRSCDDQMNVLLEPDGFVFEWYLTDRDGALAAYRNAEGRDHQPQRRKGFFASMFSKKTTILGSRFTKEDARSLLNSYAAGDSDFGTLNWKPIYT
jgi:hypothetical protein